MSKIEARRVRGKYKARREIAGSGLVATLVLAIVGALFLRGKVQATEIVVYLGVISALLYIFVTMWLAESRGIDSFCDSCGKYLPSRGVWICGFCDRANENTLKFPFFNKCEHCDQGAEAIVCSHCKVVVSLVPSATSGHAARFKTPKVTSNEPNPTDEMVKEHLARKMQLEHELELTQLKVRLEKMKASAEFKQDISEREKMEKRYSELETHIMGALLFAKEERARNAVLHKDDPDTAEMKEATLKEFLRSEGVGDE